MNTEEMEKKLREAAENVAAFMRKSAENVGAAVKDSSQEARIRAAYLLAKDAYEAIGVDTEEAMKRLSETQISLHCWQGDDVAGFEHPDAELSGGIMATGNYPGKARTFGELTADLEKAMSMLPGRQKVNVHASYISSDQKPDRNAIEPANYEGWAQWAVSQKIGLDFNTTYFSHPLSESGATLTSADPAVREFWIEHGKRARRVGEYLGRKTGQTCIINHWIPDGSKDNPIDKLGPRRRLAEACDEIFRTPLDPALAKDSVESKLFGIGAEAYTPGSHEFYMGYAISRGNVMVTLDNGHFHPTESCAQKLSALLCFMPEVLLHVSRPVRWDSDHVVIADDELRDMMHEVVRCDALKRVYIALDYFDASINRLAAWIIGARNTQKQLLAALLEPTAALREAEAKGDYTSRLALTEEYKSYPAGAVWDYYCLTSGVPVRGEWIGEIKKYEAEVLSKRG